MRRVSHAASPNIALHLTAYSLRLAALCSGFRQQVSASVRHEFNEPPTEARCLIHGNRVFCLTRPEGEKEDAVQYWLSWVVLEARGATAMNARSSGVIQ